MRTLDNMNVQLFLKVLQSAQFFCLHLKLDISRLRDPCVVLCCDVM